MSWKSLLSVLLPVLGVSAQDRSEALEAVAPLASALSSGDAEAFLKHVPSSSPGYAELSANVRALASQAECTSSIEVLSQQGDTADLDWYLEIRSRATGSIVEARRGRVRITHQGTKLLSIAPASHFAPPKP